MPNRNARSKHRSHNERPVGTRDERKSFLVICEGANTEPKYFDCFRTPRVYIATHGTGINTVSLVNEAKSIREELVAKDEKFDEAWVVFDRDSFSPDQFNNAVRMAEECGFQAAYSNQAFELWYLLHFDYCDSALHRNSYQDRLSEKLPQRYEKTEKMSRVMYDFLRPRLLAAIKNAKRLFEEQRSKAPSDRDPCTTVHILVEKLLANSSP